MMSADSPVAASCSFPFRRIPGGRFVPLLLWFLAVAGSDVATSLNAAEAPIRLLFLGDNGLHRPADRAAQIHPVLEQRGIRMQYTDDVQTALSTDTAKQFDALLVYANIDSITDQQAQALLDYVNQGGAFLPIHCASYCFRNQPQIVALIGAQFQRHGTGTFRVYPTEAGRSHPILQGYGGFESQDETYVHTLHNEKGRTVLEYRREGDVREPWTWIRTQGRGRVFYTAWGHDVRTWSHPGFHNLLERGILWAVGRDPARAGDYLADREFPVPEITQIPDDVKPFEYVDVGARIPNYTPSEKWGTQGQPFHLMQKPLSPQESQRHFVTPRDFRVELFVSEPDLAGKPIAMAWDERGRLWVCETVDYPNELRPPGQGRDRIRICEDTNGDGRADRFTVFAEQLSIPTSLAFSRGGVIVQNGVETLYLKDTDGDDRADERRVLFSGWSLGDTHGGVSNFQYGLDHWIYAMQGYNESAPVVNGVRQHSFRMGFFRFRPDGSALEFLRSTDNNTWGLGMTEEGLIFGSTANRNPSTFLSIPNRYYEQVRGWTPSLTLGTIADSWKFRPVTRKVRQVDQHGGYTAGAGHAVYTGRQFPSEYWNRVAFVNGPTGHLVGAFVLKNSGSGFRSTNSFNLLASDDEWCAPIMSEVGPDGAVWVIDWYNFIVQHNPTPQGFRTGRGGAYESELRDRTHGRIYRVIYDRRPLSPVPDLSRADADSLVGALRHPTMLVRKHAQRLLIERGKQDVVPALVRLVSDRSVDGIGLNVGAIHALWTLKGLGVLDGRHPAVLEAARNALRHPSPGVRRNAIQVLPAHSDSVRAVLEAGVLQDRDLHVRLAAVLALADLPPTRDAAAAIVTLLGDPNNLADRWIPDAATSAAAHQGIAFLESVVALRRPTDGVLEIVERVAGHVARGPQASQAAVLLATLRSAEPCVAGAVVRGLGQHWQDDVTVALDAVRERQLERLLERLSPGTKGTLVRLATAWGSRAFQSHARQIAETLLKVVRDSNRPDGERVTAARQLTQFLREDRQVVSQLLDEVGPRTPSAVASGLLTALENSRADDLGTQLVSHMRLMSPSVRAAAVSLLLTRPELTRALLDGAGTGQVSLNDLALDQKQALLKHPDRSIREAAQQLLARGGSLPDPDRQKVYEQLLPVTRRQGNADNGHGVFLKHCSRCHRHSGEGERIGPDLTGMAVHPKSELLTHIIDPSRSVEGNFRMYSVVTVDGRTLNGMLLSESRTAIELVDTQGRKRAVLREDIDELIASHKSIMPDGFEKQVTAEELTDLLEFLTRRGRYVPVDLRRAATIASDRSMFVSQRNPAERLIFSDWSPKTVHGVPFHLIDPRDGTVPNVILLYGPNGPICRRMPRRVEVACNGPVRAVHLLSGVSGWGHPFGQAKSVSMIVRLHYQDGQTEDHPLLNGVHFADYIRRVDVPGSEFAFALRGQQIRYLAIAPERSVSVQRIEFVKGPDDSAPVVMAVTLETPTEINSASR